MSRHVTRAVMPLAALMFAGVAVAMPGLHDEKRPELRLARTSVAHSNSNAGRPIVSAGDLVPGDVRTGELTLKNEGDEGDLSLLARHGGEAKLADRLVVTIEENGYTLIDGPLSGLTACRGLGRFRTGQSRTFRFRVAFPRGGSEDNELAGKAAGFDLEWLGNGAGDCAPPAEERLPSPAAPTAPAAVPGDTSHAVTVAGMRLRIEPGPYRFSRTTGTARVGVRCEASDRGVCAGTIAIERRQSGQGRGIAMATGRIRVPVGKRRTIKLSLNARARKRVTSTGRVAVRAYVIAVDARGRRHRASYVDRLVYGRARKATRSG